MSQRHDARIGRKHLLQLVFLGNAVMLRGVEGFSSPAVSSIVQRPDGLKQHQYEPFLLTQQRQHTSSSAVIQNNLFKTETKDVTTGSAPSTDPVPVEAEIVSEKEIYNNAVKQTLLWVAGASVFGAGLWFFSGPTTSEEFFAGYLVEQSLSVDNLFVFLLLFEYFKVPLAYQNRVLNWGIFGAMAMRAVMIGLGSVAISEFHEVLLVFAGILLFSSGKILWEMASDDDEEEDFSENAIVTFSQSLINASPYFDGNKFFTVVDGVKQATPLLLCLVAVEISDVVFAVDSIPAVFGVTENPLVVFTSNIFAIMGLRSLYTILSKAATDLKYLEPAVAVVLGFIGGKMIAEYFGYEVPTVDSLLVVASLLGVGIGASVYEKRQEADAQ